jgi:GNAT superfamily N-acetyltransferase
VRQGWEIYTSVRQTGGDTEAIHALNRDALGYPDSLELTRIRLSALLQSDRDRIFAACLDDDSVAGYIHGADYECTYADRMKNVMALAVFPRCQGRGLGRAWLSAVETWAWEDCCAGVRLDSGAERRGAHQFYMHCGYLLRKEHKNFHKVF